MSETGLPLYRCHKVVSAMKVKAVVPDGKGGAMLVPVRPDLPQVHVDPEYAKKHRPQPGGYFVAYDDRYQSFSPERAFEAGYRPIEECGLPAGKTKAVACLLPEVVKALRQLVDATEKSDNPGDMGVGRDSDEMQAAREVLEKARPLCP